MTSTFPALSQMSKTRRRVRETDIDTVKQRMARGDKFLLVDVREESEFAKEPSSGRGSSGQGYYRARYRGESARAGHGDDPLLRRRFSFGAGRRQFKRWATPM